MICEAYIIAWNESETIHLTIKHYQKFCERVTIFDNFSTDNTRDISESMGCVVKPFGIYGKLDDQEYLKVKNNCYRYSQAKYVIVCDADEILWHPQIRDILEKEDATIFKTIGWDIFSDDMPKDDFLEIQRGQFSPNYCKSVIFSPALQINYDLGCHVARPTGSISYSNYYLTLFHYSNIGGFTRLSNRHEQYRARLSANNKRFGLGCHYSFPEEQRKRERDAKFNASTEYNTQDYNRLVQLSDESRPVFAR